MRKHGIEIFHFLLQSVEETLLNFCLSVNYCYESGRKPIVSPQIPRKVKKNIWFSWLKNTSRVALSWSRFWDSGSESVLCLVCFITSPWERWIFFLGCWKINCWHLICLSTWPHLTSLVKQTVLIMSGTVNFISVTYGSLQTPLLMLINPAPSRKGSFHTTSSGRVTLIAHLFMDQTVSPWFISQEDHFIQAITLLKIISPSELFGTGRDSTDLPC